MDNKDFFDEEYDKVQESQRQQREEAQQPYVSDAFSPSPNSQYNGGNDIYGAPVNSQPPQQRGRKALWISLLCVGLVLALAFGWVLGGLFGNIGANKSEEKILSEVLDYLRHNYYQDIPDDKWKQAIAAGGTAILQTAGDQYSHLMTPQEYYEYMHPSASSSSGLNTRFGMSYQFVEKLGIYVSEVAPDSSSYGVLEEGDIIVKMSNVQYVQDKSGEAEYDLSKVDGEKFSAFMQSSIQKANFHVLRNGAIQEFEIERGESGVKDVPVQYRSFQYVEFYFNDAERNISITNQNFAKANTKQLRHLDQLPSDTGYIRISSFMYYLNILNKKVTAADEFKTVMDLFAEKGLKHLVLDLKGNPGGSVDITRQIAGMLVTDQKLTSAQKSAVNGRGSDKISGLLIASLKGKVANYSPTYYYPSTYTQYFAAPTSSTALCDIVIWTDSGSASASELLTGALRDYKTGFQIGDTTFGKGIAQVIEELPIISQFTITDSKGQEKTMTGHWAIYFTSASYYSPLGVNIHGDGYTPAEGYSGITDYPDLWNKTKQYWGIAA